MNKPVADVIKIQIERLKALKRHVPWKSVHGMGVYLFVRISLLHKPRGPGTGDDSFFTALLIHLGRDVRFF